MKGCTFCRVPWSSSTAPVIGVIIGQIHAASAGGIKTGSASLSLRIFRTKGRIHYAQAQCSFTQNKALKRPCRKHYIVYIIVYTKECMSLVQCAGGESSSGWRTAIRNPIQFFVSFFAHHKRRHVSTLPAKQSSVHGKLQLGLAYGECLLYIGVSHNERVFFRPFKKDERCLSAISAACQQREALPSKNKAER